MTTKAIDPSAFGVPSPQQLRTMRVQNNLSQEELGELVGASGSEISGYELGHHKPSAERLDRIITVLQILD